jgi:hypothetical protein
MTARSRHAVTVFVDESWANIVLRVDEARINSTLPECGIALQCTGAVLARLDEWEAGRDGSNRGALPLPIAKGTVKRNGIHTVFSHGCVSESSSVDRVMTTIILAVMRVKMAMAATISRATVVLNPSLSGGRCTSSTRIFHARQERTVEGTTRIVRPHQW